MDAALGVGTTVLHRNVGGRCVSRNSSRVSDLGLRRALEEPVRPSGTQRVELPSAIAQPQRLTVLVRCATTVTRRLPILRPSRSLSMRVYRPGISLNKN